MVSSGLGEVGSPSQESRLGFYLQGKLVFKVSTQESREKVAWCTLWSKVTQTLGVGD